MVGYFIRRMAWGFAQLWIVLLMVFYIVVELPASIEDRRCTPCWSTRPLPRDYVQFLYETSFIDKPWPLNYIDWLFDPEDKTTATRYDLHGNALPGPQTRVIIAIAGLQIKGSGVLTGDLGRSINGDQWTPVADMYGPGIDVLFAAMLTLIIIFMLIATLQRWRRPSPHALPQGPPAYRLADIYQHQIAFVGARSVSYSPGG